MHTDKEVQAVAKNIVNFVVAELFSAYPKIRSAAHSEPKDEWLNFLSIIEDEIGEALQRKFNR